MEEYIIYCILCKTDKRLCMIPHKDNNVKIVGWIFTCPSCQPKIAAKSLYLTPSRPDLVCPECKKPPDQCDCPLTL